MLNSCCELLRSCDFKLVASPLRADRLRERFDLCEDMRLRQLTTSTDPLDFRERADRVLEALERLLCKDCFDFLDDYEELVRPFF